MKAILSILALLLIAVECSQASEARTPDEFLAAFQAGFQEKNPRKLEDITYSVGIKDEADMTLTVLDSGKPIFTSGPLKGKGILGYNKGN
ncbi:MAG: hypothetical protein WCH98_23365 [Verrucomicrobiota bacterium]